MADFFRIDRDGDGSYEELIAAAAPASNATKGVFAWTSPGALGHGTRACLVDGQGLLQR